MYTVYTLSLYIGVFYLCVSEEKERQNKKKKLSLRVGVYV